MPVARKKANEKVLSWLPLKSSEDGDMKHPILEYLKRSPVGETILEEGDRPSKNERDQKNCGECDKILADRK